MSPSPRAQTGHTVHGRCKHYHASEAAVSARAALSIDTVSGPVELLLPASVAAEFQVSSFSGRITNELGPAAEKSSKWTPQTELSFTTGAGGARITVETLSGNIGIRKRP